MKKITFIGAGSMQFTTAVVQDITTYPALDTAEICLMDTNEYNIHKIKRLYRKTEKQILI